MKIDVTFLAISFSMLLACSGCSSHENEAVSRINEQLFDPASAQFKNLHEVDRKGGWVVCGEVNAKNRFGGYTGFRRFMMTEKDGDIIFAGNSNIEETVATALIDGLCKFPKS